MWKMWRSKRDMDPDEIFLDAANPSGLDVTQMEGRIEHPIASRVLVGVGVVFLLVAFIFLSKAWILQIAEGSVHSAASENNRFQHIPVLAERGVVYSRNGEELVWNEVNENNSLSRAYTDIPGMAHIIGYAKPPMRDSSGVFYREEHEGVAGVEKTYNDILNGTNGLMFIERTAQGEHNAENLLQAPRSGDSVHLTIDDELQSALYSYIEETREESGFSGGAGVVMDVHTGEIAAAVSVPEYDSSLMAKGEDSEAIQELFSDEDLPFLNRFAGGVFTPGSIVKPFVAAAVIEEDVVEPTRVLESPRTLVIPNPYNPGNPTVFRDWESHGRVNVYDAIAVSSNVYFYKVGGGYQDIEGLGVTRFAEYMDAFGFGRSTNSSFENEGSGLVPTPLWKQEVFEDGVWRVGDTYNSVIGQFGFKVTPLQVVRAIAALANGGSLVEPSVTPVADPRVESVDISSETLEHVREGMRRTVTDGTATALNRDSFSVAAKTGTAQIGADNQAINSWITGFFPHEEPRYAFVILMNDAPSGTLRGSLMVSLQMFQWMEAEAPEYLEREENTENN